MINHVIFLLVTGLAVVLFVWQVQKIRHNIGLGREKKITGHVSDRLNKLLLVAFGQQKMFKRPLPAILHGVVYVGFVVINIEVLEILIDGIFGTHRALGVLGPVYSALMAVNEVLALLVIFACAVFLVRRNVTKVPRLTRGPEMRAWPKLDANVILIVEIVLMLALFAFNAADTKMSSLAGTELAGSFPISSWFLNGVSDNVQTLATMRGAGWWLHILGIFAFLNYLPSSKHSI